MELGLATNALPEIEPGEPARIRLTFVPWAGPEVTRVVVFKIAIRAAAAPGQRYAVFRVFLAAYRFGGSGVLPVALQGCTHGFAKFAIGVSTVGN